MRSSHDQRLPQPLTAVNAPFMQDFTAIVSTPTVQLGSHAPLVTQLAPPFASPRPPATVSGKARVASGYCIIGAPSRPAPLCRENCNCSPATFSGLFIGRPCLNRLGEYHAPLDPPRHYDPVARCSSVGRQLLWQDRIAPTCGYQPVALGLMARHRAQGAPLLRPHTRTNR